MDVDQSLGLKLDTWYDRLVVNVTIVMFGMVIFFATVQVLVRTFGIRIFGPMAWTESAARFTLIVGTYFGAAVATRNREHISIRFLNERLHDRWPLAGSVLNVLVILITLAFLSVALYGSVRNVIGDWGTTIGGIAFITSGVLYLGIGIGLSLMAIFECLHLKGELSWLLTMERSPDERSDGDEELEDRPETGNVPESGRGE